MMGYQTTCFVCAPDEIERRFERWHAASPSFRLHDEPDFDGLKTATMPGFGPEEMDLVLQLAGADELDALEPFLVHEGGESMLFALPEALVARATEISPRDLVEQFLRRMPWDPRYDRGRRPLDRFLEGDTDLTWSLSMFSLDALFRHATDNGLVVYMLWSA